MDDARWNLLAAAMIRQSDDLTRADGVTVMRLFRLGLPVEDLGEGDPHLVIGESLRRVPSATWVVGVFGEMEQTGAMVKFLSLTMVDEAEQLQFAISYTRDPLAFGPLLGEHTAEEHSALCAALEAHGHSAHLRELVAACAAPAVPDDPLGAWTAAEIKRYPKLETSLLSGYAAVAIAASMADGTLSEKELAAGVKFLLSQRGPASALLAQGHQPVVQAIHTFLTDRVDPIPLLAKSLATLSRHVQSALQPAYIEELRGIGLAVVSAEGAGFFGGLMGKSLISADEERMLAKLERMYEQVLANRPSGAGDDPASRRARTNADLAASGLRPAPEGLPLIRDEGPRDASQVAIRAQALMVAVMMAGRFQAAGRLPAEATLRDQFGPLFDALSPRERAFLHAPDPEAAQRLAWRTEALLVLVWALGWRDALLPFDQKDESGGTLPRSKFTSEAVREARLRPNSEVLDQLDAVLCRRWIAVEAQRLGAPMPPGLLPPLLLERHHALEWLNSRAEWDDVRCNT